MAVMEFVSGDNLIRVDHTPGSALAEGDIIAFGTNGLAIAERSIAANVAGSVVIRGGIWRGTVKAGQGTLAVGTKVYWLSGLVASGSGAKHVGQVITAGGANADILFEFNPECVAL